MKAFFSRMALVLLAAVAGTAQAAWVTEQWQGRVASFENLSTFAVDDIVTWTVLYDASSGQQMTVFSDGANGRSDRGGVDDSLSTLYCLEPSSAPGCSTEISSADGFFALHDSTTDLATIYTRMKASLLDGEEVFDYWDTNRDNRTFRNVPWGVLEQIDYWADDFRFSADNYPYRCVYDCPNTGDATFLLTYLDRTDELQFARLSLTRVSYTVLPVAVVSAPSTIALCAMALGLLGWNLRQRGRS